MAYTGHLRPVYWDQQVCNIPLRYRIVKYQSSFRVILEIQESGTAFKIRRLGVPWDEESSCRLCRFHDGRVPIFSSHLRPRTLYARLVVVFHTNHCTPIPPPLRILLLPSRSWYCATPTLSTLLLRPKVI